MDIMDYESQSPAETYRPRMIIWQLTDAESSKNLSLHECLLTIDGIARTAKPIVILTGEGLIAQSHLFEIVEYGNALGLKMIVEARADELSTEVLQRYAQFGPKVFRIVVDGCVREDPETRFQQSSELQSLRDAIERLRKERFEVHMRITVRDNDVRSLAFYHDFAIRTAAEGLYCHIFLHRANGKRNKGVEESSDEIIEAIARMKRFSAKEMYVSPQCVKYGVRRFPDEGSFDGGKEHHTEWRHWCLGGKTFAFISADGKVQICAGQKKECGNLRDAQYKFDEIWTTSEFFEALRENEWSCSDVQCFARGSKDIPSIMIEG